MSSSFRSVLILIFCAFVGVIIRAGSCGCSRHAPSLFYIFLLANLYTLPLTTFLSFNLFKRFNAQNHVFKTIVWVQYKAVFTYLCISLVLPPIHLGADQKDMEIKFICCLIFFTIVKCFYESRLYDKYFVEHATDLTKTQIREVCSTLLLIFVSGFILKLLLVHFNISLEEEVAIYLKYIDYLKMLFFSFY